MDTKLERIKQIMFDERKLRKFESEIMETSTKNCNSLDNLTSLSKKNTESMKLCDKKLKDLEYGNEQLAKLLAEKQQEIQILKETNQSLTNKLKLKTMEMEDKQKQCLIVIDRLRLMKQISGVYLKRNMHPNKIEGVFLPTANNDDEWKSFSLENEDSISIQKRFFQNISYSQNTTEWMRLILSHHTDDPQSKIFAQKQKHK